MNSAGDGGAGTRSRARSLGAWKSNNLFRIGLAVTLVQGLAEPADCQVPQTEFAKITSPDPEPWTRYGHSAAAHGKRVIIGELFDSMPFHASGAAFAYERSGIDWILVDRIVPSDLAFDMRFGGVVAMDDRFAAIRAEDRGNNNGGAVYVFERVGSGWVQRQKLVASFPQSNQFYGGALALEGNTLLVGAQQRDTAMGPLAGVVIWYEFDGVVWTELSEIHPSSGHGGAFFGSAVDVSGDTAIVAARNHNPHGAVFVFERNGATWTQSAMLEPPAPVGLSEGRFGESVALRPNRVLVGHSPNVDSWRGSVHEFEHAAPGNWAHRQRFFASDGEGTDMFGSSMAVHEDVLVVGAPLKDGPAIDSGAAYVFRHGPAGWTEEAKLGPSDDPGSVSLGYAVAFDRGTALSTAPRDNTVEGSAYFHSVSIGANSCNATANSTGAAARVVAIGSRSVTDEDLTLIARAVPANQFGIFLVSRIEGFTPTPPGSVGNLCLGVPIGRFAGQILSSGSTGILALEVDLSSLPFSPPVAVTAGTAYHFQAWFRDVGAMGPSSNFTDRTTVHFE